ncbi:MAG: major facilitator superfamily 1 [Pseudomonas sp.]|jgi:D-galactonate transporter|uniref:MFS transporter n=1 Tax=Pseudomonas sp. TaxID=306 RepID=UPI00261BC895|nr:MFS transporter [Pseudomonas sp.]MDB6047702.1 major facilitator superfamily 1 [Pseudomonas sp.]
MAHTTVLGQSHLRPETFVKTGEVEHVFRRVTLRLIPLLAFVFILACIDRTNIGFAKLSMSSDLNFSEAVYGLGAGIFFIGYFLFEVPSNLLMVKIGARKTLARITILWGITSICMMYVSTPLSFYIVRFLLGVCEAGFYPGVILYLTYWFPASRRAKATGLFMISIPLASVIGGPIAGAIMKQMVGVGSLDNWQWLFLIEGIPSIIAGIFLLFFLPEKPDSVKWLSAREKSLIHDELAMDGGDTEPKHASFRLALSSKRLWICAGIFFCLVAGNATLVFWVPSIIYEMGVHDALNIGLLSVIPSLAGTLAMILNSSHSDKTGERRLHCALAALLAALGLILTGVFVDSGVIAMITLTMAAIGVLGAMPIFWSFPSAFLSGTAAAGGIALINCLANLAGFVAPYAIGSLKVLTGSVASGLYFVAGLEITAAIVVLALFGKARHQKNETLGNRAALE